MEGGSDEKEILAACPSEATGNTPDLLAISTFLSPLPFFLAPLLLRQATKSYKE